MSNVPSHAEIRLRERQPCRLVYTATSSPAPALVGVLHEVGDAKDVGGYEQFSLLFHAEEGDGPRQGMYVVAFEDDVAWDVFLVPVARAGDARIVYEACFNRARSA